VFTQNVFRVPVFLRALRLAWQKQTTYNKTTVHNGCQVVLCFKTPFAQHSEIVRQTEKAWAQCFVEDEIVEKMIRGFLVRTDQIWIDLEKQARPVLDNQ
jgi:hypothetical protein